MPYTVNPLDLSAVITPTDKRALVPDGNRITDVSILPEPSGNPFRMFLKFGNNPPMGPFTAPCTVSFDPGAPAGDVREGVYAINDTAQAGVVVPVIVSYVRNDVREVGGVRVLA